MKRVIGCLIIFAFFASGSHAANIDTYGIGSKATSMGGAFTAYADDVYAPYYNPAGLVQIDTLRISGGVMVLDPKLETENYRVPDAVNFRTGAVGLGPTNIEDDSPNLYAPHLGFAMPVSDQLTLGVAAYVPWPQMKPRSGRMTLKPSAR